MQLNFPDRMQGEADRRPDLRSFNRIRFLQVDFEIEAFCEICTGTHKNLRKFRFMQLRTRSGIRRIPTPTLELEFWNEFSEFRWDSSSETRLNQMRMRRKGEEITRDEMQRNLIWISLVFHWIFGGGFLSLSLSLSFSLREERNGGRGVGSEGTLVDLYTGFPLVFTILFSVMENGVSTLTSLAYVNGIRGSVWRFAGIRFLDEE